MADNKNLLSSLSSSPDQSSPSNILNALHDNALLEIFERLDLDGLCRVLGVCKRFNCLSKEVFTRKHKYLRFTVYHITNAQIEYILRNFGTFTTSIYVRGLIFPSILSLIHRHCSANLKQLEIGYVKHCEIRRWTEESVGDSCLQEELTGSFSGGHYTSGEFPKLEELYWLGNTGLSGEELFELIKGSRNLQKLQIDTYLYGYPGRWPTFNTPPEIFHVIEESLPHLVELDLDIDTRHELSRFEEEMVRLANLKSLRRLKIDSRSASVLPLIRAFVAKQTPLEQLKIRGETINSDTVKCICELKSLKVLSLTYSHFSNVCPNDDTFIICAKELPEIEEFQVSVRGRCSFTWTGIKEMILHAKLLSVLEVSDIDLSDLFGMSMDDYKAILKIVKARKPPKKLTLGVSGLHLDVPKKDSDWLSLKNLHHYYTESE